MLGDLFESREEAGLLLAERLVKYASDPSAIILSLPRGGVTVGYAMSQRLHLPLDVFITRKLGAPENPEYALGAVTEAGSVFLNPETHIHLKRSVSLRRHLEEAIATQQHEISRRQVLYRKGQPLPALADRTVLLVDDGIATGATFLASTEAVRQMHPKRIVAAIPVGPADTVDHLSHLVEELVVLQTPAFFFAVGNHYANFAQVDDSQVLHYLELAAKAQAGTHQSLKTPPSSRA